jgi:hypothetical protein
MFDSEIVDPDRGRVTDGVQDTVKEPAAPGRRSDLRIFTHASFLVSFKWAKNLEPGSSTGAERTVQKVFMV